MYAVIETGGKQYRATEQTRLRVEKLEVEVGSEVRLERVLLLSGDTGVKIGRPYVDDGEGRAAGQRPQDPRLHL
jgi:large subunit ribosomal protein L21